MAKYYATTQDAATCGFNHGVSVSEEISQEKSLGSSHVFLLNIISSMHMLDYPSNLMVGKLQITSFSLASAERLVKRGA